MSKDDLERKPKPSPTDGSILPLDEPSLGLRRSTPEEIAWMRSRLSPLNTYTNHVREIVEDVVEPQPAVIRNSEPTRPKRPLWLPSEYKPRKLTEVGAAALESLGPEGSGILGYPTRPLTSLQERRDMLAARYAAHDMLRRGLVVEVMGAYYFYKRSVDRDRLLIDAFKRMPRSDGRMSRNELGYRLAMYRVATADQIFTIDPENAFNNFHLLLELERQDRLCRSQVRMGRGTIEIWYLGPKYWLELKEEYPEMELRGFGPMRSAMTRPNGMVSTAGRSNAFGHPLHQVDAIHWFTHEAELDGKEVRELLLDRYLRLELNNHPGLRCLDFRLWIGVPDGPSLPTDIEVIGSGSQYRSKAKKAYVTSSSIVHKSFSATPHQIDLGRHVCIGR
jgi:hypothetical protein